MKNEFFASVTLTVLAGMTGLAVAAEYSPNVGASYPTRVLFGDTHLHTAYSTDAGMIGDRLGPEEALRFAMGEEVTSSTGVKAKLARPLDFLVIADHAENLGLPPALLEQNLQLMASDFGKQLMAKVQAKDPAGAYWPWQSAMNKFTDPLAGMSFAKTMWQRLTDSVEKYNQPGRFTALIGFEWTSIPGGNNLHCNVIFRDGNAQLRVTAHQAGTDGATCGTATDDQYVVALRWRQRRGRR